MLNVEVASVTDIGCKRSHNEDAIAIWEPDDVAELARSGSLYIVADGVGGAAAGEVASRYAADVICYQHFSSKDPDLAARLVAAIIQAGNDIFHYNQSHPEQREMGTTLVAAVVQHDRLIVANVGDSRAYLVCDDEIEQITIDHNVVARMLAQGEISDDEAAVHPWRNQLTRCLGKESDVGVDAFERQLGQDNIVILCSDGLTRHVRDEEMKQIVREDKPASAASRLVNLAKERGGQDNISIIILKIGEGRARTKQKRGTSPAAPDLDTTYTRAVRKPWWRRLTRR